MFNVEVVFLFPIYLIFIDVLSVFFNCRGGGLVAYSDAKPHNAVNVVESSPTAANKKRVVVLGTGWAGTSFLKNLDSATYDVHVISPRNYFAFTPLLPSVTCGTVEARSVVEPIRNIIRKVNPPNLSMYYLWGYLTFLWTIFYLLAE